MKTIHTIYLAAATLALAPGCAMKTKILDVQAVSMTRQSLKPKETLKETGPVSGEFCPDMRNDKGTLGLIDESTKRAQDASGADFITSATYSMKGNCIVLEGTGQKVIVGK